MPQNPITAFGLVTPVEVAGGAVEANRPGVVPNDQRDQALAAIHRGLQKDVPFGLGAVFEALAQANFDKLGFGINVAGKGASHAAQGTDANARGIAQIIADIGNLGNLPGGPNAPDTPGENASAVWDQTELNWPGAYAKNALGSAAWFGHAMANNALCRLSLSPNFLTVIYDNPYGDQLVVGVDLSAAAERNKAFAEESDENMLIRLYPQWDWVPNFLGTPYVGSYIEQASGHVVRPYFYVPIADMTVITNRVVDIKNDTIKLSNGALATEAAEHVWQTEIAGMPGGVTGNGLLVAAQMARIKADNELVRLINSINFLTVIKAEDGLSSDTIGINLNLAGDRAKTSIKETDLAMLQRVYPHVEWVEGFMGTHYIGANLHVEGGTIERPYFYAPVGPSLADMREATRYTPMSGGADRWMFDDFVRILALIPVKY